MNKKHTVSFIITDDMKSPIKTRMATKLDFEKWSLVEKESFDIKDVVGKEIYFVANKNADYWESFIES